MSLYYSVRTVIMFAIILLAPLFLIPTVSHAATTCTDTYSKSVAIPTGYGAAYNLFSSAKEMLVKTDSCTDTSASVTIGNGDASTYIYKLGYYWNGTSWQTLNFTGDALISGTWYTGTANGAVALTSGNTSRYYVGYTCLQVNSVWKCGCQNTACTVPAWQLQQVNKTTTNPTDPGNPGGGGATPVCGNNICEAGETTALCAQDCPASHAGERGRVHIRNNIVLTDRNTPLRGATTGLIDGLPGRAVDVAYWKRMHDLGLNAVRFSVLLSAVGKTLDQQLPAMDKAVDLAAQNHMYIMIHNAVRPGHYNLAELKAFWTVVAPRYKNRTHVFYEVTNEPVAWLPHNYTAQNIADLKSVYDIMRAGAPDTHIALFDFASLVPDSAPSIVAKIASMQGIDYTKASVAWHHYIDATNSLEQTINYIQQRYPLLMTETNYWNSDAAAQGTNVSTLRLEEKLGVGWFSLDGWGNVNHLQNEILPNLHAAGYNWAIEN